MKSSIVFVLALLASYSAQTEHCEVSNKTVKSIDKALHSREEVTTEIKIKFDVIPALKTDSWVASKLKGKEFQVLGEHLAHDVLENKYNIKEVIQEFLAE